MSDSIQHAINHWKRNVEAYGHEDAPVMLDVIFVVDGNPMPWQTQMRNAKRTLGFERMQAWQDHIRLVARQEWLGRGYETAVNRPVKVFLWFALARCHLARNRPLGPDATNFQKAAEDALKGIIFGDDSATVDIRSQKLYTNQPEGSTLIRVQVLGDR